MTLPALGRILKKSAPLTGILIDFMTKKLTIFFLFSVVLMIISEYTLLQEAYNHQRLLYLLLSGLGLVIGASAVFFSYKKYQTFRNNNKFNG